MTKLLLVLVLAGCGVTPEASSEEGFGFGYCLDYKHCTSSTQCPSGQYCYNGDCRIYPMATRCDWYQYDVVQNLWTSASRNAAGDRTNCAPYVCDGATGWCRDRCTTTSDCAVDFTCGDGACRPRIDGPPPVGYFGPVPAVVPDREMTNLCSSRCEDRAGKSYETCHNDWWIPNTTRCYDNLSMLYWGSYWVSCGAYTCDVARGYCNSTCKTSLDCAPGHTCDVYAHTCD